jgi:hypothetical protein
MLVIIGQTVEREKLVSAAVSDALLGMVNSDVLLLFLLRCSLLCATGYRHPIRHTSLISTLLTCTSTQDHLLQLTLAVSFTVGWLQVLLHHSVVRKPYNKSPNACTFIGMSAAFFLLPLWQNY